MLSKADKKLSLRNFELSFGFIGGLTFEMIQRLQAFRHLDDNPIKAMLFLSPRRSVEDC